jgi:D-sedoheptulose 7-phosphate isomerase
MGIPSEAPNPSPHLDALVERQPALKPSAPSIIAVFEAMRDAVAGGGTLFFCGNGGSASDAEHWTGELLKGFGSKRPLPPEAVAKLPPEIGAKLQGGIRAIPLNGFLALSSAFANDVDPSLIYAQLVWALGKPGDLLVGISTSGDAGNVAAAAQTARAIGIKTVALTGRSGGKLKPLCDISICVPSTETYRIQEFHLPIYHCLSLMLEDHFFPQDGRG